MSNTNIVVQTGRMGSDVKFMVMPTSNTSVAEVSIAVKKHRYNSKTDKFEETTSWIPVKFFGDLADRARDKLSKGTLITVVGELSEETWKDKITNQTRSKLVVIAHSVEKIAGGKNTVAINPQQGKIVTQAAPAKQQNQQSQPTSVTVPSNY